MTKKDRLLKLIEYYSAGNKSEFARLLGVTPQAITTWIARDTFDTETIYAKCVNINADWLLTGAGNMLKGENKQISASYSPSIGTPYYDVDFIGGFSEVFNDQTTLPTCNIVVPGLEKATVWCNVTGHSMEPRINHGDIIALRECTLQDVQYGEIYAVVLDTLRTIKMLRKGSTPDKLLYVPINKTDYDEQEFSISRIKKIFEVIGSISKFF